MDLIEVITSLGVAAAAGLLIGLEREQAAIRDRAAEPDKHFLGGARTHPLYALGGAISMLLADKLGLAFLLVSMGGFLSFLLISYAADVKRDGDRGVTSEIAFVISFLLGALTLNRDVIPDAEDRYITVAATAVVVTVFLSIKPAIHALARKISADDMLAAMKFLVAAVVVLPLLPNRTYGPLDVLNPYKIGLMVVLIAGIGFVGYASIRTLGPGRGLGVTGLVGGLASSTAVTLGFSGRAKETPALRDACALAVVLASTVMLARVLVEVAVVNADLLRFLLIPLAAMVLASLIVCWFLYRKSKASTATAPNIEFKNPFELSSAIKFGLLFAGVLFASKAATTYLGSAGIYLTGLLAGATDVDAITLSMANLAKTGAVSPVVAVTAIIIGVGSNTVVKGSLAVSLGGWAFGKYVAAAYAATLAAGGLGLLVLRFV